jgi:cysteine desulfurase / selenocysteine lyase
VREAVVRGAGREGARKVSKLLEATNLPSYPLPHPWPPTSYCSCSSAEYASNAIAIMKHSRDKLALDPVFLPNTDMGGVDMERLAFELSKPGRKVAAVVLTHAPTNGGLINNAEGIGKMIKGLEEPPLFLLDACQTVGQVELDVKKLKVDLMAGTSRKWLRWVGSGGGRILFLF